MPSLDPSFLTMSLTHRALHDPAKGLLENSAGAIRAAIDAGYGIEIDVQLSADGKAMVFHDPKLDRLTGQTGWVGDHSAAELGQITLNHMSEGIPTFAEVLKIVEGRVPLLVELKDQTEVPGGTLGPLEEAVARDVARYAGPIALMSFAPEMVANLAGLCPDVARGLTGQTDPEDWSTPENNAGHNGYDMFDDVGAAFISHRWQDLQDPSVGALKSRGVPILCWTVKSEADEVEARRVADNITFEGFLAA